MTALLEIKERIRSFCIRFEVYLVPVVKSILAFITFYIIRTHLGYMNRANNMTLILVLALACALLPANMIVVFAAVLVLLQLYALSKAACLVCFLTMLVLFMLYFRFTPKKGYYAVLTPLAFVFNIPYVMPLVIGLLDESPASIFAMIAGGIMYYQLNGIVANASSIAEMTESDSILTKFSDVFNQFIGNREMVIILAILLASALVIWIVRRLPVDHAWSIAIAVGSVMEFVLVFIADVQMKLPLTMVTILVGVVVSALVAVILKFFFFNLDYTRVDRVQFEDDEYYYYVKAVPKIYVSNTEKKVQKFSGDDTTKITKKDIAREMDIDENLLQ
ncbi:MAG: hypothetical protein PUD20_07325 [bacterium]|nr:hypothetical protein [bacterium]